MDPRENKLPKWAQELLQQERMKYLVRFPDQPAPEPDISEHIGHGKAPRLQWIYSQNSSGVYRHWVGKTGYLYHDAAEEGHGSQVRGKYWLHKEDAELAHLWAVCTECALRILRAKGGA